MGSGSACTERTVTSRSCPSRASPAGRRAARGRSARRRWRPGRKRGRVHVRSVHRQDDGRLAEGSEFCVRGIEGRRAQGQQRAAADSGVPLQGHGDGDTRRPRSSERRRRDRSVGQSARHARSCGRGQGARTAETNQSMRSQRTPPGLNYTDSAATPQEWPDLILPAERELGVKQRRHKGSARVVPKGYCERQNPECGHQGRAFGCPCADECRCYTAAPSRASGLDVLRRKTRRLPPTLHRLCTRTAEFMV
jgi:hypothetical protein